MKNLVFSFLILLTTQTFANPQLAKKICPEDPSATLLSDWKKNSKDEYCAKASCTDGKGKFEREKCFFRSRSSNAENAFMIGTKEQRPGKYHGSVLTVLLNPEEPCLNACKPEKGVFKTRLGLDRKECVECFKERAFTATEGDLHYPELGRVVKKGSKCYYACRDKEGPIIEKRVLTEECNVCLQEKFSYFLTQAGKCFEVDADKKLYGVEESLCSNNLAPGTTYIRQKSISQWIFGNSGTCYEVDLETLGQLLKRTVPDSLCDEEAVNNSDRNTTADKSKNTPSQPQKKSSASGQ